MFWRPSPNQPPGYSDYVCMWPQYPPLDGWYYGLPSLGDGVAAPRDAYLKLEPTDYSALPDSESVMTASRS